MPGDNFQSSLSLQTKKRKKGVFFFIRGMHSNIRMTHHLGRQGHTWTCSVGDHDAYIFKYGGKDVLHGWEFSVAREKFAGNELKEWVRLTAILSDSLEHGPEEPNSPQRHFVMLVLALDNVYQGRCSFHIGSTWKPLPTIFFFQMVEVIIAKLLEWLTTLSGKIKAGL